MATPPFDFAHRPELAFDFDHPPPFSWSQVFGVSLYGLTFVAGSLLNGFLSYVLLKNRSAFANNVNLMLTTMLNLADCFSPTILTFYQAAKLYSGRYALGFWGCQTEAVLISLGVDWSLFAIILIAVERYYVVVKEIRRPWQFWRWPVLFVFFAGILLAILPLLGLSSPYAVQPSGIYCMDDLNNVPDISRSSQVLYLTMWPLLLTTLAITYFKIYRHVSAVTQQTKQAFGKSSGNAPTLRSFPMADVDSTSTRSAVTSGQGEACDKRGTAAIPRSPGVSGMLSKMRSRMSLGRKGADTSSKAQQQAFKTSIGITACFFVMLTPYLINLVILTCGYQTPPWFDGVLSFCGISNLLTDAVVVYTLNPRVRAMVKTEAQLIRSHLPGATSANAP
ncbi:hypothetical protein RI367_006347 [Sorochytrium milnesiophthora]